jgi:hypothetical protein
LQTRCVAGSAAGPASLAGGQAYCVRVAVTAVAPSWSVYVKLGPSASLRAE